MIVVETRIRCRIFIRKPFRKLPLGKPRLRWEDNIKIYIKEVGL
jgi:hypothetical protein